MMPRSKNQSQDIFLGNFVLCLDFYLILNICKIPFTDLVVRTETQRETLGQTDNEEHHPHSSPNLTVNTRATASVQMTPGSENQSRDNILGNFEICLFDSLWHVLTISYN